MWIIWKRRVVIGGAILLGVAVVAAATYFIDDRLRNKPEQQSAAPAPAPRIVVHTKRPQPKATQDLGFPEFATKNTTRVASADPVADAAGVALAVFPSTGGVPGPDAVTLIDSGDWQAGVAAAALVAPPVSAPILLSSADSIPPLTEDALRAMAPGGSAATQGAQVFRVGDVVTPSNLDTEKVSGNSPAAIAAAVDSLRQKLTGQKPEHVLLTTSDDPSIAMPAASWAARSGDAILFSKQNSVPQPTIDALKRYKDVPAYVLGPSSAISDKVLTQVDAVSPGVKRIGDSDPVQNAIDFARYVDGSFGWNITDPGHGMVIASDKEPMDAAAAAPLSASGDWGPLLITDDPQQVPAALRGFLLDIKPGYVSDPTRAVYNHAWIIGDPATISVDFQAQLDDLEEVAPVRSGTGGPVQPPPAKPAPKQGNKSNSQP